MNELDLLWRGCAAGLIVAAPVGPVNVFCIRQTLAKGWRSGLLCGLGAAAGDTLYGAVAAFSIRFIIRFLVQEQSRIRLCGGILLLVIGIAYFIKRPVVYDAPKHRATEYSDVISTFLLNLTNLTAVLSLLAILAALGLGHPRRWSSTLFLVGGIFCGSMAWWIVLSAVVKRFRGQFGRRAVLCMNRVAGSAIGGFGVVLMVLSRSRL